MADYARDLGAVDVVDYSAGDVVEQLRQKEPAGLAAIIDLFHDAQGAVPLAAAVRPPGGRIVSPIAMGLDEVLADQPVSGHVVRASHERAGELASSRPPAGSRSPPRSCRSTGRRKRSTAR